MALAKKALTEKDITDIIVPTFNLVYELVTKNKCYSRLVSSASLDIKEETCPLSSTFVVDTDKKLDNIKILNRLVDLGVGKGIACLKFGDNTIVPCFNIELVGKEYPSFSNVVLITDTNNFMRPDSKDNTMQGLIYPGEYNLGFTNYPSLRGSKKIILENLSSLGKEFDKDYLIRNLYATSFKIADRIRGFFYETSKQFGQLANSLDNVVRN
jgi:hypothetical protein